MRAFVAVDLDRAGAAETASRAPRHLTLRFFGDIADERVPRLVELLGVVGGRHAPFAISVEGLGAFPSAEHPRVVWVGVKEGREELEALADDVRATLEPEFGGEARPFVAHLTLFRVRGASDRQAARELLEGTRPSPPALRSWVDALVLKESLLEREGALHRPLASIRLTGETASVP